jgi:hypothetical protein
MFKTFKTSFFCLTVFLLVASWVVLQYVLVMQNLFVIYIIIIYMAVLTFLIHNWLTKAIAKRPAQFVASFIGAITIKMLLSLVLVGIIAYFNKPSIKIIGVSFIVYYFAYTALNVRFLLRENK